MTIKFAAKRAGAWWFGVVIAVENGRKLWAKSAGIKRISRADAILDAKRLAGEIEAINSK